jgi:hypothetical protein
MPEPDYSEASMTLNTHAGMTGRVATPADVGAKHIRWRLGLARARNP